MRRWLPTFLAYPAGGLLAITTIGAADTPARAAAGGLLAGAVLGAAQWLALRGPSRRWIGATALALAAGSAAAVAITDGSTATADLVLQGAIAGTVVGAAQAPLLRLPLWAPAVGGAWALAWLITSSIGVDVERGYVLFGSSGAVTATLLLGLVLRVAGRLAATPAPAPASAPAPSSTVAA